MAETEEKKERHAFKIRTHADQKLKVAVLRQFHPAFVAAAAESRAAELPPRRTIRGTTVIKNSQVHAGTKSDLSAAVPVLAGGANLSFGVGCGCVGHRVYSFPTGVEFSGEPFSAHSPSKSRAKPHFELKT